MPTQSLNTHSETKTTQTMDSKIKKTKSNYYKALTMSQTKILESLATYKFLTSSQMVTLGVMTHEKNINTQIRFLRGLSKPLMGSENYGSIPKIGRLESIHFLTKKGKQLLISYNFLAAPTAKKMREGSCD